MTVSLSELTVLALDCQATGANPHKGHLLELGWQPASASPGDRPGTSGAQAYLNRLPADEKIPRAVARITGISDEFLVAARSSRFIWQHLMDTVKEVRAANQAALCPTVIHFARFEEPFLRDLHRTIDPAGAFPFRIICTHEIAMRLLPDLPRRGLRAVAGYFNHSMPELKRSADHVVATAVIWKQLIGILAARRGVDTLDQLGDWLTSTDPPGRSGRIYPMAPEKRLQLPDKPGIYRMQRANGDLLYIGKAKSLKMRVNSYFRKKAPHAEHILEMLSQARKLDFALSESALEAALLESDEIKRHSPPYNIALRRRQRRLVFCTKDLSRHSTVADRKNLLGPLPDGKVTDAASSFAHWITRDCRWTDEELAAHGYHLVGRSPEQGPDPACLREGLEIFREDHLTGHPHGSPLRLLTALGAMRWRLRLAAAEAADAASQDPQEGETDTVLADDAGEESVWTPETVARSIDHMIMHSAHLIRRARWFCLLSESSLAWDRAGTPGRQLNLMVLEGGAVIKRGALKPTEAIPVPPRADRPFQRRQNHLSLITYDRLRVLTTELRRLIAEKRPIRLRLGPNVTLGADELKRALRWV
ncbi:MAG: GIY-YIG nuclease family protein [Deltaproteobacteria bacterium]|jgi:DNA polymerase-3 subunit epsilon|nr:GIY-YIG nuclease family protein [Deltaproteobacteria bacterium]